MRYAEVNIEACTVTRCQSADGMLCGRDAMESSETAGLTRKAVLTRQRIVETALRLFAAKGYEQTTMRDIAKETGCALGLAYRYFASKEELVLELYRWLVVQLE